MTGDNEPEPARTDWRAHVSTSLYGVGIFVGAATVVGFVVNLASIISLKLDAFLIAGGITVALFSLGLSMNVFVGTRHLKVAILAVVALTGSGAAIGAGIRGTMHTPVEANTPTQTASPNARPTSVGTAPTDLPRNSANPTLATAAPIVAKIESPTDSQRVPRCVSVSGFSPIPAGQTRYWLLVRAPRGEMFLIRALAGPFQLSQVTLGGDTVSGNGDYLLLLIQSDGETSEQWERRELKNIGEAYLGKSLPGADASVLHSVSVTRTDTRPCS